MNFSLLTIATHIVVALSQSRGDRLNISFRHLLEEQERDSWVSDTNGNR